MSYTEAGIYDTAHCLGQRIIAKMVSDKKRRG